MTATNINSLKVNDVEITHPVGICNAFSKLLDTLLSRMLQTDLNYTWTSYYK